MKKNYSFFKNASYALMGVKALLKESAFKIELCLAIPLAVISLFIKASKAEHILLIGVLLLVLAAEAFNTAIEACVDLNTQKWHKEAKLAKDCGSAGVFFLPFTRRSYVDDSDTFLEEGEIIIDENLAKLCKLLLGVKRYEILAFLCANVDKYGLIKLRIKDIEEALDVSKPTVLATFKLLGDKQLFEKLKNGFYRLHTEKINSKIKLGDQNAYKNPLDMHLHLRDKDMLKAVAPLSARHFSAAVIMPNLLPPISDEKGLENYKKEIEAACENEAFYPS